MVKIHTPHLILSNVVNGDRNKITQEVISETMTLSTEYWTNEPTREYVDAGVITAKKGYTWITKWELGKNYISTRILDESGNPVGIYWDITSQVEKLNGHYQAYDWYLDVFQISNSKTVVLDEDELTEALQAGFVTQSEAEIARKNAQDIFKNALNH